MVSQVPKKAPQGLQNDSFKSKSCPFQQVPGTRYKVPGTRYQSTFLLPPASTKRHLAQVPLWTNTNAEEQVPGTRYQVPGTRYQVPGTRYQVPGTKYQVPARYQVPGTRYLVPGTWYQIPGTRYQVPSTRYQLTCQQLPVDRGPAAGAKP